MELFYCDACGMRIKSGDGLIGPAGDTSRYCEFCYAKKFPDAVINSAPVRTATPSPGAFKSGAVIGGANESSSRRKPSKQEPVRGAKGPSTTLIAAGGGGAAALLLLGFMIFGGKSEPAPVALKDARREEKADVRSAPSPAAAVPISEKSAAAAPAFKRDAVPPSAPAPAGAAAESRRAVEPARPQSGADAKMETGRAGGGLFAPDKAQAQGVDDFRENYARRRLDELLTQEQKGSLKPADLRKRVGDLASGYSNTVAGKEAAEKLKVLSAGSNGAPAGGGTATVEKQKAGAANVPAADTIHPAEQAKLLLGGDAPAPGVPAAAAAPAAGETRILWKNSFDAEEDWKIVDGSRETGQTRSGAGMAVRSESVSPGYFTARITLKFNNSPVKLGANSWLKFTYRTQGTADICFHIAIGNAVYEKFMFGIQPGKWKTASFHFNQFGKCITRKNDSQPAPNSDLQGLTMFLGGPNAAGASILLDDVVIGDGPIPEE